MECSVNANYLSGWYGSSLQYTPLLIFLSIIERAVLESPTVIMDLCVSPFLSVSFYIIYFEVPSLGAQTLTMLHFPDEPTPFIIMK